jgi:hypothetical protein
MARKHPIADGLASPDLQVRTILIGAAAVVLMLVIVLAVTFWFFRWNVPHEIVLVPQTFPQPRLMQDETMLLKKAQSEQRARLSHWKWIDRDAGVASVPIDVAMHAVRQRPNPYAPLSGSQNGGAQ